MKYKSWESPNAYSFFSSVSSLSGLCVFIFQNVSTQPEIALL